MVTTLFEVSLPWAKIQIDKFLPGRQPKNLRWMGSLYELLASSGKIVSILPKCIVLWNYFPVLFTLPPLAKKKKETTNTTTYQSLLLTLLSLSGSKFFFPEASLVKIFFLPQFCLRFSRFSFALFCEKQSKFFCCYLVMLYLVALLYVTVTFQFLVSCLLNPFCLFFSVFAVCTFSIPHSILNFPVSVLNLLSWKSCFCLLLLR